MAAAKDISIKIARMFIDSLREAGIDVSEAYLSVDFPGLLN